MNLVLFFGPISNIKLGFIFISFSRHDFQYFHKLNGKVRAFGLSAGVVQTRLLNADLQKVACLVG